MIQKIAKKIYLAYRANVIAFNVFNAQLNEEQKKEVDWFARHRDSDLTFGDMFKSDRTYYHLGVSNLSVIEMPEQIQDIIDKEGYYCPDYRKGLVYKKNDKLKSKPVKLVKILNKGESDKQKFQSLKKIFDQRLKTSRKDNVSCEICITHRPYDVAGMSTDRNWVSCVDLMDGVYRSTALNQVQFGGMCAYLIYQDDRNIEKPIARIAIKRFVGKRGGFIFMPQNKIYGDVDFANELNFLQKVSEILDKSNQETFGESTLFQRDDDSYSDSFGNYILKNMTNDDLYDIVEEDIELLDDDSFIQSLNYQQLHHIFDLLIINGDEYYVLKLFEEGFLNQQERQKSIEFFIENNTGISSLLRYNKLTLSEIDALIDGAIEHDSEYLLNCFITSHININENNMNKILDYYLNINLNTNILSELITNHTASIKQRMYIFKKLIDLEHFHDLIQFINDNQVLIDQFKLIIDTLFDKQKVNLLYGVFQHQWFDQQDKRKYIDLCIKKHETRILLSLLHHELLFDDVVLDVVKEIVNNRNYVDDIMYILSKSNMRKNIKDEILNYLSEINIHKK